MDLLLCFEKTELKILKAEISKIMVLNFGICQLPTKPPISTPDSNYIQPICLIYYDLII